MFINQFIPPIVKTILKKISFQESIPKTAILPDAAAIGSFSQQYEDLIIDQILRNKAIGFYVDIGAYDPVKFSNTKRFYMRGWNGINVEPQVNCYVNFNRDRPNDTNLNCGIHNEYSKLTFYQLEIETLSTFNKDQAVKNAERFNCRIVKEFDIPVYTLEEVFDKYLPEKTEIDFISIDTEGNELNVLYGNNWVKYAPWLLLIEYGERIHEIDSFLKDRGYHLVYLNNTNCIYLNRKK